jgi:hypothetical protein
MEILSWATDEGSPARFGESATTSDEDVSVHALDPSVGLAAYMLVRDNLCVAERVWRLYAPEGRLRRAFVPGFVAALAAQLGAGVRRTGPGDLDFAIVSHEWAGESSG